MKILFIHQNFPGQFRYLAPTLVKVGHEVHAFTIQMCDDKTKNNIYMHQYVPKRSSSTNIHSWLTDFETKLIRAEACFELALLLKNDGFIPDLIIAHHGWGESLFLKDVWPSAKLGIYCEFFYQSEGLDIDFDPEFSNVDLSSPCRIKIKNLNNFLHFDVADAAISPTNWQASTFPLPFRNKISVIHDGINTDLLIPNPDIKILINNIQLSRQDEVITFVNRNLEPYRGYHIFMRSLPEILKRRPKARVLIVGGDGVSYGSKSSDGRKWKDIFIDEVRNNIPDADWSRVHFLGNVSYENYISILQLSSVHVYLTYPFVLSWSLIEAMSMGCTIVASNTGPVQEVITHNENGILVDFFNKKDLIDGICTLLNDAQLRDSLGIEARKYAIANFDLYRVCLPKQIQWVKSLLEK